MSTGAIIAIIIVVLIIIVVAWLFLSGHLTLPWTTKPATPNGQQVITPDTNGAHHVAQITNGVTPAPPPPPPPPDQDKPPQPGSPCKNGKCADGAFCGDDKMCYETCVAKGTCEADKVPRKNTFFCDYSVCTVDMSNANNPRLCNPCPDGWTETEKASRSCKAPDDYDGPCGKTSQFARYTTDEAKDWAIKCNAPWSNPCTSGCCYCVYDGKGAPWNAAVSYTGDFNDCAGWCYNCRDHQGIGSGLNAVFHNTPCNDSVTVGWQGC